MHYYQFNIGDYQSHTAHLSDLEDLAYRRLLDWYYLHETPIPNNLDEIARQIRMRTHTDCIASVLQEFFAKTDQGWINSRADKEIAKTIDKSEKAKMSAKSRWDKPKDATAMRTHTEGNATQDTLHITQDTLIVSKDTRQNRVLTPACPIQEIIDLYNTKLPMLSRVTVVNDSRKRAISARWREVVTTDKLDKEKGIEFFDWFFDMVGQSKFLTGRVKDWKADIDFLFNPSKFPRIVEGAYHKD